MMQDANSVAEARRRRKELACAPRGARSVQRRFVGGARVLFGSNPTLSMLVLLCSFAASAPSQASANVQDPPTAVPSAQASATSTGADTYSLACKLGSPTIITNDGTGTLPAGTKILVRFNPSQGAVGGMKQKVLRLKADLAPGLSMSFRGESFGFYQSCTARVNA